MKKVIEYANSILSKYTAMCGGFPCGKCLDIAKEISNHFEGKIVAGFIGSGIQHYWFEYNGNIIDPMYQNEIHQKVYEL